MDVTKGALLVLMAFVVLLNLQILYLFPKHTQQYADGYLPCERKVFISFSYQPRGKTNQSRTDVRSILAKWNNTAPTQSKLIALKRYSQNYLAIGIPTAKWKRGPESLTQTLQSIVDETTLQQKLEIVVVIALLDSDLDYNHKLLKSVLRKFQYYVDIGFIHVLQPGIVKSPEGAKSQDLNSVALQVMADYAPTVANYYLHLADDVECAPGFYHQIRHFIGSSGILKNPHNWVLLEFSEVGLVGKMIRTTDLQKFATFIATFMQEAVPIERTLAHFRHIMLQQKQVLMKPTLFQRVDSPDGGAVQKDRFFDPDQNRIRGDDPDGKVYTNLETIGQNLAEFAYKGRPNFFWAKAPKAGDWLTIVFDNDADVIDRVVIQTGMEETDPGSEESEKDKAMYSLKGATVKVSPKLLRIDPKSNRPYCAAAKAVGEINKPVTEIVDISKRVYNRQTKCLTISINSNHTDSVMFQAISVFMAS